jgi:hypothetical protein
MVFDQKSDDSDARRRMRVYDIFKGIRAGGAQSEVKRDDVPIVETRRVVSLAFDKPSGAMKKRAISLDGSAKKGDIVGGGPVVMKCMVYELDTSI